MFHDKNIISLRKSNNGISVGEILTIFAYQKRIRFDEKITNKEYLSIFKYFKKKESEINSCISEVLNMKKEKDQLSKATEFYETLFNMMDKTNNSYENENYLDMLCPICHDKLEWTNPEIKELALTLKNRIENDFKNVVSRESGSRYVFSKREKRSDKSVCNSHNSKT